MIRTFVSFPINNVNYFKKQLLNWTRQLEVCCFLDNNNYSFGYNTYECILAAGVTTQVSASAGDAFNQLQQFFFLEKDWIFGHLGYDLKNESEQLQSSHTDGIAFPDLFFFVPAFVVLVNNKEVLIGGSDISVIETVYEEICSAAITEIIKQPPVQLESRFTKKDYIIAVQQLQQHILKGDCYEINFCQEFFSKGGLPDPLQLYISLCNISPNPFAAFYKINNKYLCCASPERYLKKVADKIISQPIKGTGPRDLTNEDKDCLNKQELLSSIKERTENVMIVDLVRNDLSKVSEEGSVNVEELYAIYSYPQVHQMISTITGKINKDMTWVDALKATFPMGSMTGAPKKRVMELIEQYEKTKRGLFSGAVGYVTPDADFDFNVVIRSVFFNLDQNYLSYQVGSAITSNSDPEKEYEECLLKAAAIKAVLS